MKPKHPYDQLFALSKQTAILSSVYRMLEWDQETYLPLGAIASRSEQIEALAALIHKKQTSGNFQKL